MNATRTDEVDPEHLMSLPAIKAASDRTKRKQGKGSKRKGGSGAWDGAGGRGDDPPQQQQLGLVLESVGVVVDDGDRRAGHGPRSKMPAAQR